MLYDKNTTSKKQPKKLSLLGLPLQSITSPQPLPPFFQARFGFLFIQTLVSTGVFKQSKYQCFEIGGFSIMSAMKQKDSHFHKKKAQNGNSLYFPCSTRTQLQGNSNV